MLVRTLLVIGVLGLTSIHIAAQAGDDERQAYVDKYSLLAIQEMERTGIPASIKLGQAVLESRYGTSTLARKANNHFGIKCGGRWKGGTYYLKDDDYVAGKLVPSCFRSYMSTEESFVAHSNFLISNARYAGLFSIKKSNYKAWAKGLKKAGYATANHYHKSLIRIIEDMELHRYDKMSSSGLSPVYITDEPDPIVDTQPGDGTRPIPVPPPNGPAPDVNNSSLTRPLKVLSNNDVKYVITSNGTTLEQLAKDLKMPAKWLLSYNDHLSAATQELEAGEWVYIQPKRKNFRGRQRYHEVSNFDDMFSISQRYGINLKALYERNQMTVGTEPSIGSKIKLRGGKVKTVPQLRAVRGAGFREGAVPPKNNRPTYSVPKDTARINLAQFNQPMVPVKPRENNVSSGTLYHKVSTGESLESIARQYSIELEKLREWNGLKEGELAPPGSRLRVR